MDNSRDDRITQKESTLVRNMVERLPLSCVCFEPMIDDHGNIENFLIVHANAGFESIIGLDRSMLIGRTVADTFGKMNTETLHDLVEMISKTYRSTDKTCEVKARVFEQVYKVSFLFISEKRLLITFEDIHAKYFREHYHRSIPRDVIQTSFAKAQLYVPDKSDTTDQRVRKHAGSAEIRFVKNFKPLEIIHDPSDIMEPYDAVFRDSLTGLYDRVFAAEALRFYVDSQVLPMSVALGDINGLKTYNESLGFQAGDELLVKIARVLGDNCRGDDVVTRWNDDQFLLMLPHASQAEAQQIIKRLQSQLNMICNNAYNIVTFGYATSETECRAPEDLIREAEQWIYQKKLLINQSHRSSIIRLLLSMLHAKSAETEEHSDRMALHCRWIADQMGLSEEMADDLVLLSMLHDIGKIGVPDEILNKPGPLTDAERKIINQHPEIGYRIAQTVPELKQAARYILAHHERWDGTGYPKGLRGEEIPVASQIIAAVDAYDVMITGRKYQPAKTKEEAIAELKRCAGTQFNPAIVKVYVKRLAAE